MSTVILTSNAYHPSIGGIENSLRHLAKESLSVGLNPVVVVSDIGVTPSLSKLEHELIDGVYIIRYPLKPLRIPLLNFFNLIYSSFLCWRVYRSLNILNPDAVVIARFHLNALLARWAGFKKVRYLVPSIVRNQYKAEVNKASLHGRLLWGAKISFHSFIQKLALRRCENFVFSNTMLSQSVSLAKNDAGDYVLVKPGVDSKRFHPTGDSERKIIRENLGFLPGDRIVLFVGRFVKAKGISLVLKAMQKVSDSSIKLIMVGEGAEKDQYFSLIRELGLEKQVRIMPSTRNVEIYYQVADTFVMSSCYEPLGQTILEALSSGLPVVAFKNSDVVNTATEELQMDTHILYANAYTADALSEMFKKIQRQSYSKAMTIHREAEEKFSWHRLFLQLIGEER